MNGSNIWKLEEIEYESFTYWENFILSFIIYTFFFILYFCGYFLTIETKNKFKN